MVKLLLLAVIVAVPLACFHLITGPLHMPPAEGLTHIVIALMAVAVHKLTEVLSASYRSAWAGVQQRVRAASARMTQRAGRILARLAEVYRH